MQFISRSVLKRIETIEYLSWFTSDFGLMNNHQFIWRNHNSMDWFKFKGKSSPETLDFPMKINWFKGKSTRNHRFSHLQIMGSVIFPQQTNPLNHSSTWRGHLEICPIPKHLPSGKHTKNYGTSSCLMDKSTFSMAMFNSYFVCLPPGKMTKHDVSQHQVPSHSIP